VNYGETLAYWYFRLNGFLPLANFVLHRFDAASNADSDLLAVRFPHVYELIGGQENDWDNARFNDWGLEHSSRIVCLIVEVKTGGYYAEDINSAFSAARLDYALQRLGALKPNGCRTIARALENEAIQTMDRGAAKYTFAKVLMSSQDRERGSMHRMKPCCHIELRAAADFIRERMHRYKGDKEPARLFFPNDLIQYFAWEAKLDVAEPPSIVEEE
jgi:hypothetical protein